MKPKIELPNGICTLCNDKDIYNSQINLVYYFHYIYVFNFIHYS